MQKVFIPERIAPSGLEMLKAKFDCIIPWETGTAPDPSSPALRDLLPEAEAIVVRLFSVGPEELDQAPNLKIIVKHGVGVDSIDCDAATARSIPVAYTPGAIANGAAEHVVGLMLALSRLVAPGDAAVRAGRWERSKFQGVELAGKTLGVVGLGRIGSRVAEKASRGLEMKVIGFDPVMDPGTYSGPAELRGSFEEVLRESDYVTLHVPLTDKTRHFINTSTLDLMKPTCRLVNTSRGAVIDEADLVEALKSGRIAGAALDVYESEPPSSGHPLFTTPNTLLTPHVASSTVEGLDLMSRESAQAVIDGLAGRKPEHVVNPQVLK